MRSLGSDQEYSYSIPILVYNCQSTSSMSLTQHKKCPNSTSKMSSFGKSSLPSSPSIGFSAQKFDTILPLIVFLATYFKSNFANKVNHLENLPLKASFSKRYFNGSILTTTYIWKSKTICLNFYTAQTSAKNEFSIGMYLVS